MPKAPVITQAAPINNELANKLMELNEWRVLESIYDEMTHELTRLDEIADCHSVRKGAFTHLIRFKEAMDACRGMLLGASNKDEECCLVCGDADYEEDNLIGYCDLCGLSVHKNCYGLGHDAFKKEFICLACRAFGKYHSMLVKCVLCGKNGGAIKPLDCKREAFFMQERASQ